VSDFVYFRDRAVELGMVITEETGDLEVWLYIKENKKKGGK